MLSDLVLENDLTQIGYDSFFQRLYCLIRYRLILDWDLTAKDRFSALQSARGQIGGKISKGGGRPPKKTEALLTKVREMKSDGLSDRAIAKQIKVSPTTIGKWLKVVEIGLIAFY